MPVLPCPPLPTPPAQPQPTPTPPHATLPHPSSPPHATPHFPTPPTTPPTPPHPAGGYATGIMAAAGDPVNRCFMSAYSSDVFEFSHVDSRWRLLRTADMQGGCAGVGVSGWGWVAREAPPPPPAAPCRRAGCVGLTLARVV